MSALTIALACGLSLSAFGPAATARAEDEKAAAVTEEIISGRWTGAPRVYAEKSKACDDGVCKLTLDLVKCGTGWCGIEVDKEGGCGATALRLGPMERDDWRVSFQGKLELARFTEPYVVEAAISARSVTDGKPTLAVYGNTGPELMLFRRTFPLHVAFHRDGEAKCKVEPKSS